ncbi:T6SS phospholipase effector Tle1-like catalytic domain-containing protein [Aspergillus homomorphus CBS 101889]|uniref:T6SS Phospholipase effector Tle1-like catalytic domain-containing protein n=1 Tax=Aspergillus homomorphus (strain CBS 101889) TaxID=1450537 RepID=A0A395HZM4_ASPHC|nr:hypothetical protein BO97DRAFT_453879 [Aspergillus homomorphus CBS 101889]RAL11724.1 hypothetical protein BO97DRAFT_453879 [Aspergillus homomorphus CBS 101889]
MHQDPQQEPKPARKRIIICCDGTWQSAVDGHESIPSNVTRLCRAIASVGIDAQDHQPWQQIIWYDPGVGTNTTAAGQIRNFVEGALGKGLEGNIVETYHFCALNWNPSDQILCFGFSRGAYTARAIAGLISDIGICPQHQIANFPQLQRRRRPSQLQAGSSLAGEEEEDTTWEESSTEWASTPESREVQVVGVFDTVGNLGFPELFGHELPAWLTWTDKPEWHNAAEKRRDAAARDLLEWEDSQKEPSRLTQAWFPGFHIHIWGESSQTLKNKSNFEEMSNIVVAWMLDQIKEYVSLDRELIEREAESRQNRLRKINEVLEAYKKNDDGNRNHGLSGCGAMDNGFDITHRLNGSLARTPRRYLRDPSTKAIIGHTCEQIHPTVGYWLKHVPGYRPAGLNESQCVRRLRTDGLGYEYRFRCPGEREKEILPEWKMESDDVAWEQWAIQGKEALAYVNGLECRSERRVKR